MENIRNSNTEPQKETSFPDYEKLKTLRQQLFEELPTREYSASSLVRGKEYNWSRMSQKERLLCIGEYLNTVDTYKTFSLRFSEEKIFLLEKAEQKADYFRRLVSANCRRKGYKIPSYAFVFEREPNKGYLHIHGVINYHNIPEDSIRFILKTSAFGHGFSLHPMNKYILKIKPLEEGIGWLSYMIKSNKFAHKYIYISNELKKKQNNICKLEGKDGKMIDSDLALAFARKGAHENSIVWKEKITGDELVQEVIPFISKVLGVNASQARVIFCWCLHTHYWWEFEYSPRLIFKNIPQNIDTFELTNLILLFCTNFVIIDNNFENSAPLAIGDIFNPIMLINDDNVYKRYRQQINLIIENGYKNSGSVTSGLCSYVCFYPLCLVTKEDIDTKIESKITIPLFYDVATLSEEMVEKARLLNAKIHAFFNKIDFYSVIDTSETNCVIQTWQPIYRIAELISQNFYKQVVKDTLKIAYEASGQA